MAGNLPACQGLSHPACTWLHLYNISFFFMWTCVLWHICTCVCLFTYVNCVRGCWKLTSGVFLCHSPPCVLSQGFSLNLELADSAILASQLAPGVSSLPGRAVRHHTCPALLGILDLNSDPHTCIANSPGPLCTVLSNRDVLFQGTRHIIKAGGKRQPCLIGLQPLRGALFSGVTVSSLSSPPPVF